MFRGGRWFPDLWRGKGKGTGKARGVLRGAESGKAGFALVDAGDIFHCFEDCVVLES
jgi:hypothetical protein